MKNIFYFISSKGIGTTFHLARAAKELKTNSKNKFTFISDTKEQSSGLLKELAGFNCNVKLFGDLEGGGTRRFIAIIKCISFLIKNKPEIIHAQTNIQLVISIIPSIMARSKIFYTIHSFSNSVGGWRMRLNKIFLFIMCRLFVTKAFAPSGFVKKSFWRLGDRVSILPLGYAPGSVSDHALSNQPLVVVYSAKYHLAKNHLWLIHALSEYLSSKKIILALPGDGTEFSCVMEYVQKSGLDDVVEMPGWLSQDEIKKIYQRASIAIIPSSSETFGHNIVEPLAFGLPVISFPVGVALDIEDGCAVQIIDFFNAQELISRVEVFIKSDFQLVEAGKQAKQIFKKNFTWSNYVDSYDRWLSEC